MAQVPQALLRYLVSLRTLAWCRILHGNKCSSVLAFPKGTMLVKSSSHTSWCARSEAFCSTSRKSGKTPSTQCLTIMSESGFRRTSPDSEETMSFLTMREESRQWAIRIATSSLDMMPERTMLSRTWRAFFRT